MTNVSRNPKEQLIELFRQAQIVYEEKAWLQHAAIMANFSLIIQRAAHNQHCLLFYEYHSFDSLEANAFLNPPAGKLNDKLVEDFFLSAINKLKTGPGRPLLVTQRHAETQLILISMEKAVETILGHEILAARGYSQTHSVFALKQSDSAGADVALGDKNKIGRVK